MVYHQPMFDIISYPTIPTFPCYIGDHDNNFDVEAALLDLNSMWTVRPQLFSRCTIRPLNAMVVAKTQQIHQKTKFELQAAKLGSQATAKCDC